MSIENRLQDALIKQMQAGKKPIVSAFTIDHMPYTSEILKLLDDERPTKMVTVKKGCSVGCSSAVIMPLLGYVVVDDFTQPGIAYNKLEELNKNRRARRK